MIERRGLTLVGLTVTNLEHDRSVQLMLPLDRRSYDALDSVVDEVRNRFGTTAITRAVLLGRDTGLSMPMLPD
jgi:DNA polymerase-4